MAFAKSLAGVIGAYIAISLTLWGWAFRSLPFSDEACTFGAVSSQRYATLIEKAFALEWTVWPGISEGLFWPSDSLMRPPTAAFQQSTETFFLSEIQALVPAGGTFDDTLAAGHALMRSIGATFWVAQEINDLRSESGMASKSVHYTYYIPQRRFAPLCLICVSHPASDITFQFQVLPGAEPILQRVVVRHSDPKYVPSLEPGPKSRCPNEQ